MSPIVKRKQNLSSNSIIVVRKQMFITILICSIFLFCFSSAGLAAQKESETNANTNATIGAASLILQPLYLAVKLAVGITGTTISGLTLLGTAGDEEKAGKIFKDSWAGPWGVPALFTQNLE